MSGPGPRFISEKDVEKRKQSQEAAGVVEEPYDGRSLYERLQVEKDRKQEEYEAANAFKNCIHRLDKEEVDYLHTLALKQHKTDLENEKEFEELLMEAQTSRPVCSLPQVSETSVRTSSKNRGPTQRSLLANAVKRLSPREMSNPPDPASKRSRVETDSRLSPHCDEHPLTPEKPASPTTEGPNSVVNHRKGALQLIGLLPGLTEYSSSDSIDSGSESSEVEEAACTLFEVSATRMNPPRSYSSE